MYNKFILAWFSLFHCENDLDASTKVSKQKDQYNKLLLLKQLDLILIITDCYFLLLVQYPCTGEVNLSLLGNLFLLFSWVILFLKVFFFGGLTKHIKKGKFFPLGACAHVKQSLYWKLISHVGIKTKISLFYQ